LFARTKADPSERRRAERLPLRLPVRVVKLRQESVEIVARTRDLSSAGAYFVVAEGSPRTGSPIEFYVTLDDSPEKPVELRCRGRVVRVEPLEQDGLGVGASIDRYQFVRPRGG
jgi:hypothetical protein